MNFAQLRQRKHDLLMRFGSNRGVPSIDDDARSLNYGLLVIGRIGQIRDPSVEFWPVAGFSRYSVQSERFGRRIHRPKSLIVAGVILGLMTPDELHDAAPDYRIASGGKPNYAAYLGNREIMFDRPFDQATVDLGGHFVDAWIIPGAIASDGSYMKDGFPYSDGFGNGLGFTHGLGDSSDDDNTLDTDLGTGGGGSEEGEGDIGDVTFTETGGDCTESNGDPDDLGEGGGSITGQWPTPPTCGIEVAPE